MIKTAIVVEGGAMRGIFSAGVLDALSDAGLTDFDLAIGTSAGACNLASFVAGQRGRNKRCYLDIMCDPSLFSARRAIAGGHFMDLDWLWTQLAEREPLDEQAVASSRTQLVSTSTCAQTGKPLYHRHRQDALDGLKGGCALPLLYRGPVNVQGDQVVDGGVAEPIPAGEAYRRGARRLLVIRSRPVGVRKKLGPIDLLGAALLSGHPALARATARAARTYGESATFVEQPPGDAELIQLAPPQPLRTGRTTQQRAALEEDYALGYRYTQGQLPAIETLLTTPADRAS